MDGPDQHQDPSNTLLPFPAKGLKPQPFGNAYVYPSDSEHGVSISLPTWELTWNFCKESDEWMKENIKWCYPRFFVNPPVRKLAQAALQKLDNPGHEKRACLLFPSQRSADDCSDLIRNKHQDATINIVKFSAPEHGDKGPDQVLGFATFYMVVFPDIKDVKDAAMSFWINAGGGLTTRRAMFIMEHLQYLGAECAGINSLPLKSIDSLKVPSWIRDFDATVKQVRTRIAELSTPDNASLPSITAEHVTLYPTGMSAIYHASQAVQTVAATSTVVAFGWMYDESVHNLKHGPWQKFIGYKRGTEQDLDDLTQRLEAGERIGALFCEIPSNIFLSTMALPRLRALADEYGFMIACDDTVAGFVNLDLMSYVDVMLTSLTKSFSGASDVTGGSVIVNPASRHFAAISSALQDRYEPSSLFPQDIHKLDLNSRNLRQRAQKCNESASAVARILHAHPLVKRLNYPQYDESLAVYQTLMRKPKKDQAEAGYGSLMSVIFHNASVAERFYDALSLPKGASFGTNFTIAIPFAIVQHSYNLESVAESGMPEHIIRISVGLEDVEEIKAAVEAALAKCGRNEE